MLLSMGTVTNIYAQDCDEGFYAIEENMYNDENINSDSDDTTIVHQLPPGGSSTGETPSYKLQIINTDLQQSRIVDIHLADSRTPPTEVQGSSADVRTLALLEQTTLTAM